jgi:hypothetical protein
VTTFRPRSRAFGFGTWSRVGAFLVALAASFGSQACTSKSGGTTAVVTCGEGTEQNGTECSISFDASILCGPGTTYVAGACVPVTQVDATTPVVSCGAGTMLSGSACVPASSPDASAGCGPGTTLSGGVCVPVPSDAAVVSCGPGTVNQGGTCVLVPAEAGTDASTCGAGTHECSGECYANDDATHCGATCAACPSSTPACVSGACACTFGSCPSGQACVSGGCVAAACTTAATCPNGMCCSGTCIPGGTCCTASDCPALNACQTSVACTAGQCVYAPVADGTSCPGSGTCCGGTCDFLQSDKFNCGACGASCYGGAVTAMCSSGHCAQLVAQAVNNGNAQNAGGGSPGNLGAPTLAIDANNVYFLAPSNGQILQAPLNNPGNDNPQVVVTNNATGTLVSIAMLTVDASNVYYAPLPPGFLVAGATLAYSVPIGGGTQATFKSNFANQVVGNVSLVVDSSNLYMSLFETIGVAPKTGGTFASLTPNVNNGNEAYGNLVEDGTYLYWILSNANYSLARYTLATGTLSFLSSGFSESTVVALAGPTVWWATTANIMAAPTSGAMPATTWETVSPWIGYMNADPATGDLYWINSNGPGGGWGTLYKASHAGQSPVVIMPGQNWGTPVFDASNVYYMTGYSGYVQVWRSPK